MKDSATSNRQVDYWERMGVPHSVAKMQAAWERRRAIVRMRDQGMTYVAIAKVLKITPGRISEIVFTTKNYRQHRTPPVMEYLAGWGEWSRLRRSKHAMHMIGQLAIRQTPQRDWLII